MNLGRAPQAYDRGDQDRLRNDIEIEDRRNRKVGQDINLASDRLILTSSGGVRWALVVNDAGTLSTEAA